MDTLDHPDHAARLARLRPAAPTTNHRAPIGWTRIALWRLTVLATPLAILAALAIIAVLAR